MTTIIAAQHFFGSVPAEQSPAKRRGYQTLFCTRGLTEETIRAIEDRAQYTSAPHNPVKRQFYSLPTDQVAISQSVALAELDEFGRKGRYLTHTLILRGQDFQQLGSCPLDMFTQFQFVTTLSEVFRQGQMATAEAPSVQLPLTSDWQRLAHQALQHWPAAALAPLGQLAWQSELLIEQHEPTALFGSDTDQLSALGILFLLASPLQRTRLSFDTHAVGCDWGPGVAFWAHGYSDQSNARTAHQINCQARTVTSTLASADNGPYAVWMLREALPNRLSIGQIGNKQQWAAHLEALITGQVRTSMEEIPLEFIQQFARLNTSAVMAAWAARLPSGLSSELSQKLVAPIAKDPTTYLEVLAYGQRSVEVREFMFQGLLSLGTAPAKSDRQVLEKWIKASGHPGLLTLLPFWDKDGNAWFKSLMALKSEDYETVVRELARWPQPLIPLWEALVGPHASTWIKLAGPTIPPGDWKKALPILEKLGNPVLEELAGIVFQLQASTQDEIKKWLKGYKGAVPGLRSALGIPAKAEKGFFGK